MLAKSGPNLRVVWQKEGNAIIDGEDAGSVLARQTGFVSGRDSDQGALFRGCPAKGLMGVGAAKLGKKLLDPVSVRSGGHRGSTAG
jgi:hypothetical protein